LRLNANGSLIFRDNFIFNLRLNPLLHNDEIDDDNEPRANGEYFIALVLVAAFLVLYTLIFQLLIK
jgi:hypothetical protein